MQAQNREKMGVTNRMIHLLVSELQLIQDRRRLGPLLAAGARLLCELEGQVMARNVCGPPIAWRRKKQF